MDFEDAFFNVDEYKLHSKEIGKGTFGTVYIADNIEEKKQYAIKIMNSDNFDGKNQMLLLRESLINHKLNHPGIVKFKGVNFQSFSDPDKLEPSIVTEYLPNGSLKTHLNKERRSMSDPGWSPTKKYISLLGISSAMQYLHQHHIIHRDLKPDNILTDANYYPRVCDFGLSRCFSQNYTKSLQLTMTGQLGTPLYMAPEIFRCEKEYGPSVDVFAFGIMAYEISTGKQPYSELSGIPPFVFMAKVNEGYRPQFSNEVPEKMQNLIKRCWSEDPSERPSFEEIFQQLSTDFSYSSEQLDEEEIFEYLQLLENHQQQEEEDNKNKMQPTKTKISELSLSDEIQKIKQKCESIQNELDCYKNTQMEFALALSKLHGNHQEKNYAQCINFLSRASSKGNSYASYLLGLMLENGEGVEKNFNKAAQFYKLATQQGNSYGINRIAYCFDKGYGVLQDFALALEYYKQGEKLGNSTSINNIGYIYAVGNGVKADYSVAVNCFKRSADLNDPEGLSNLAAAYENGIGVQKDLSLATQYYKKAAELGHLSAQQNYQRISLLK